MHWALKWFVWMDGEENKLFAFTKIITRRELDFTEMGQLMIENSKQHSVERFASIGTRRRKDNVAAKKHPVGLHHRPSSSLFCCFSGQRANERRAPLNDHLFLSFVWWEKMLVLGGDWKKWGEREWAKWGTLASWIVYHARRLNDKDKSCEQN